MGNFFPLHTPNRIAARPPSLTSDAIWRGNDGGSQSSVDVECVRHKTPQTSLTLHDITNILHINILDPMTSHCDTVEISEYQTDVKYQ